MHETDRAGVTDTQRAIAADIDMTRDRMAATVEEIAVRLSPERLKRQAKQAVHDATIGRVEVAARRTAVGVRRHPRTIAGIVAGLALIGWGVRRVTR